MKRMSTSSITSTAALAAAALFTLAAATAYRATPALAQAQPIIPKNTTMPYRDYTPIGGGYKRKNKPEEASLHESARHLMGEGKFEEAIGTLQKVVADDPRNDDAWHDLGISNQRLGRNAEAAGNFERALSINPKRKDSRARLGEVQLALGSLPKAEEQLSKLKELCPAGCDEVATLETAVGAFKTAHPG